jgi:iron-sulfur cluster repair protein YtfE (RIC family)
MTTTQVGRMLDEDHRANLDLLSRVEAAVGRAASVESDPKLPALLREFANVMEMDIERHFRFEEDELFPKLEQAGDGAIVALMEQEHDAIREVAEELLPLVREVVAGPVDEETWDRLRLGVLELVERQLSHIQKETMAVLPLLEDVLDPETDGELALGYAAA